VIFFFSPQPTAGQLSSTQAVKDAAKIKGSYLVTNGSTRLYDSALQAGMILSAVSLCLGALAFLA
jgi:hypothetical protein